VTALDTRTARRRSAAPGASRPASAVTVLVTAWAYFMVTLDALVVVTALPSVHRDVSGNFDTLH
jgi:hypothetical protein